MRVVILGAGFAGLYAAIELDRTVARDPSVEVLLIDPQNFLLFTPMLHEVASGSLDPSSIVVPIRETLRRVKFLRAETTSVDVSARTVTVSYGLDGSARTIAFDQLLICAGSQTRFPSALRPHVHGMKTIHDALLLRSWLIGNLERAEVEADPVRRRALLTVAVAGGGFSGVETIGAIGDYLRQVARQYPNASIDSPKLVLVEPMARLLPEFEPSLGEYTEAKLRATHIDVRLQTKVVDYDGRTLRLESASDRLAVSTLQARTLIWTAGVGPSPLIESLALKKERGRIVVDETMAVPDHTGIWACGDCAAVPGPSGKPCPPTAQHAMRQGRHAARNIAAAISRREASQIRPYRYQMMGQFAAIGRHRAVATLFGRNFSGFFAWLMWRAAYLAMLPRLERKVRVFLQWTLEVLFARDTVQLVTAESVRLRRADELLESGRAAEFAERLESR